MTSETVDLKSAESAEIINAIEYVSVRAAPRWRAYCSASDMAGQLWAWWLGNPAKVTELQAKKILIRRMFDRCRRYGEKQRAQALGYDPSDQWRYSVAMIIKAAPEALDSEATPPNLGIDEDGDPLGEWAAPILDVRRAFTAMPWTRKALRQFVADGTETPHVKDALYAVRSYLNGNGRGRSKILTTKTTE